MLPSKLNKTIIVPYLIMILSMKQTSHLENVEVGANGLAFAQDFYNTHAIEIILLLAKKMKTNLGAQKQQVEKIPVPAARHSTRLHEKELRTYEDIEDE